MSLENFNAIMGRLKETYSLSPGKENKMDEKAEKYLIQFLDITRKYNIKTFLIISPTISKDYIKLSNELKQKNEIERISKNYKNLTYLDYSSENTFNDHPEKFSDIFHLNKEGSQEFSTILSNYLTKNLH